MAGPRIGVFGGINMDMVVNCPTLPKPGQTLKGSGFGQYPGGKGANQAVAAAKLGGSVRMFGHVGADMFGERLLGEFDAAGVDRTLVQKVEDRPTGTAFILVAADGENLIAFVGGANDTEDPAYLDLIASEMRQLDAFLIQLECPTRYVERIIEIASSTEVPVILNPAPAATVSEDTLRQCSVLLPNESEAEALTGVQVRDLNSAAEAASKLAPSGIPSVIVTRGKAGASIVAADEQLDVAAPEVTPVDTVAAGDVFAGAFAVKFAEGRTLPESVEFANAAAAISTTRHGAQPSIPSLKEVEEQDNQV